MVANIDVMPGSLSWLRLARLAKFLASLTLIWLGIEGVVGVIAGVLAGSIALVAFGLDSAIEGLAKHHRDLAVHGNPDDLGRCRTTCTAMGGNQLLPARTVCGSRSYRR
jgi:hypothetical protein